MNRVLLLNRSLTIASAPVLVQGWGGENIGVSRYSPQHNCHIMELPVDVYNRNSESLMKAAHILMRKWEPQFIEEVVPEAVREYWDMHNVGLDKPEGSKTAILTESWMEHEIQGAKRFIEANKEGEMISETTHHKTLERIAREENISLDGVHGAPAKLQVIRDARIAKSDQSKSFVSV